MSARPTPNRSYPSAFEPGLTPEERQARLDRHYELCSGCKWDSTRCLNDPEYCVDYEKLPPRPVSRFWLIVAILFTILMILMLLWRINDARRVQGSPSDVDGRRGTVDRTIEDRSGAPVYRGAVAVWLEPGGDLNEVIVEGGIDTQGVLLDSGDGKYALLVEAGREAAAINALEVHPDVADAGYVYEEE